MEGGVPAAQGALWIATRMGKERTQRGQRDGADRAREKQGQGKQCAAQLTLGVEGDTEESKGRSGGFRPSSWSLGRVVTVCVGSSEEGQELHISVDFTSESQPCPL